MIRESAKAGPAVETGQAFCYAYIKEGGLLNDSPAFFVSNAGLSAWQLDRVAMHFS
ncbi:hypothetical protein Plim_2488 [Planctopirus limnophila DSM 3776]|uniref:Uncharacterized protein n=1 Tax=Planctopirus limnophila (strain ATCC 43296 / DSM 3776 / IFAM 1008 / Mu 290) TaxID=521674 RepID=D5SPT9_PLAL2|nr:hypothetical protein Plim_2488 [Planctopirus limnophila DSM 3776]